MSRRLILTGIIHHSAKRLDLSPHSYSRFFKGLVEANTKKFYEAASSLGKRSK